MTADRTTEERAAVRAEVVASRRAQGLPDTVEDPDVLRRIARSVLAGEVAS